MTNYFIKCALIRAVKTICQTAVATIGTATVLTSVDWKVVVSASILAGILSILTSIASGLPEVKLVEEDLEDEVDEIEDDGEDPEDDEEVEEQE